MMKTPFLASLLFAATMLTSCGPRAGFTGARNEVTLMTLDPGHFHAALVQKVTYDQIGSKVYVYAPEGPDVQGHLDRIQAFNTREENPTDWEQMVYTGEDFLRRMTSERPGNVVVISGNNRHKTDYIKACADAGLNQLVDKPMCIDKQGFARLLEAFDVAAEKGVLLYDIMTERSEINTILQKALMHNEPVFGELRPGSLEEPAVELESVHHLFKYVSGRPLKRPGWFMDTSQQGEGIVDVTAHLIDLATWQCFPGVAIDYQQDIEVLAARRWPTRITREQYQRVTGLDDFIPELKARLDDEGVLPCYANGEISFRIKGVHVKVRVMWNYEAPEGGKDTHFAVLRGTKANLVIRQGAEQNYRPELTIEPTAHTNTVSLAMALPNALRPLQARYPGVKIEKVKEGWHVIIPEAHRIGHEAHFGKVTERFLQYLVDGKLPDWEIANMKAKYYVTTTALEMAR